MTNVLVTGGAGFVGSHVVDELIDKGYDVTVVDNLTEQVHDQPPDYMNEQASYVWGDVRDRDLMIELLANADILSHQASAVGVGQSMYEIERYVETNTLGTARILDLIVKHDIDLEKFVIASSMSIYGEGAYFCPNCGEYRYPSLRSAKRLGRGEWEHRCQECNSELDPRPTTESKPKDSTSVYAITKKDQEELTLTVSRAYDIPAVALRYFNIYGSRQSLNNPYTGVCAIFSSRIKNDNPPKIFEDGHQTRDFIHVSDVARANRLAIEREKAEDVALNIGTGKPKTIREIAEILIDLYGKRDNLTPEVTSDFRQGDIRHCYADTSRAESTLDFSPETTFESGMSELVEWARNQESKDNFERAHEELLDQGLIEDG